IPHAEMYYGGGDPAGGGDRIAEKVEGLGRNLGGENRTDCTGEKNLIDPAPPGPASQCGVFVRGVRTSSGQEIHCDSIIANSDVVYTYRDLIDEPHRPHWPATKLQKLDPGGSGMVLLLGVDGEYPQLAHHTK